MSNLSENFNATKKRLLEELTQGRESAVQLQTLLHKVSATEELLAIKILRSFTEGLSMLGPCTAASAGGDGGGSNSTCIGGRKKKKTGAKDRRGCYKRKRSSDSWTTISPTTDDGRAWRKYGQKDISNSEYPRWYYRCTNKNQGCKATKQVQKIKEEPFLYQTTYFNPHTCTDTPTQLPHELILESDPLESNLLSFQPNSYIHYSPNHVKVFSSSEEDKHMACFPEQAWSPRIVVGDDDIEEAVSGLYSCGSMTGSRHGHDMEVNQSSFIDFDEI